MLFVFDYPEFSECYKRFNEKIKALKNDIYSYDTVISNDSIVEGVPTYIEIICKTEIKEFQRIQLEAAFPVDNKVIFEDREEKRMCDHKEQLFKLINNW